MRTAVTRVLPAAVLVFVSAAEAGAADRAQIVAIAVAGDNWEITVPLGHATLIVPQGAFRVVKTDFGGGASSPRHFLLKDEANGEKIVSGWLEPARKIADVKQTLQASWREEATHLKKSGIEPFAVEVGETGDWATISYQIPDKRGSSVHILASRIVADTWIDLQLSVTGFARPDENRARITQLLKSLTFRVR